MVRLVAAIHPTKGKILLMSTDLSLSAIEIIELYGLRFKIELSFKQAVNGYLYCYEKYLSCISCRFKGKG